MTESYVEEEGGGGGDEGITEAQPTKGEYPSNSSPTQKGDDGWG